MNSLAGSSRWDRLQDSVYIYLIPPTEHLNLVIFLRLIAGKNILLNDTIRLIHPESKPNNIKNLLMSLLIAW